MPGAVAKGAYEAGVISILAKSAVQIDRIVATSSGALNGIVFAAGIRSGTTKEMTENLIRAWVEEGSWQGSFSFNPLNLIRGRGLSGRDGLLNMLNSLVKPVKSKEKREVQLRIVVSPLEGVRGEIGGKSATTYEKVLYFEGKDFDTAERLSKMFDAVTAACAFPGLFAPVNLQGLGPCVDGGIVNNAPIRYALEESDVDRVIVPVPFPDVMPKRNLRKGFSFVSHLIEILINERLFRDLHNAQLVNEDFATLERLVARRVISPSQASVIRNELQIRRVQITEVRPISRLKGGAFSGFMSKAERIHFVEAGQKAAIRCLSTIEPEADPNKKNPIQSNTSRTNIPRKKPTS